MTVYISFLDITLDVDENGRFELPQRLYTAPELNKIALEVNRSIRKFKALGKFEE